MLFQILHFLILGVCIVGILVIQIKIFKKTLGKLSVFRNILPQKGPDGFAIIKTTRGTCIVNNHLADWYKHRQNKCEELKDTLEVLQGELLEELGSVDDLESAVEIPMATSLADDIEKAQKELDKNERQIKDFENNLFDSKFCDNPLGQTIIAAINNYLLKNRNSSADFHLIKDIVDRNSDAAEEEIDTQIPVPLYCGLAGTMLGVIIGVGALWLSGGLSALMNATEAANNGAGGIEALIGGVALAMISSLCGVVLTTWCSLQTKDAKKENEERKHNFLSWIQAELLPVLSTDAMSAINQMTANLADFNETFARNAQELNSALSIVSRTTKDQTRLFETLENLKIQKVATANIEVYDKLKNCTDEIGNIAECLKDSRRYLEKVEALSSKLDDADQRVRLIEEMARFFKEERANLDAINGVINKSMGEADNNLQQAAKELKDSISNEYSELGKHFAKERENFEKVADEQQAALEKRMDEIKSLTAELKNLSAVKSSMESLVKATESQNKKLDSLSAAISELALIKSGADVSTASLFRIPRWVKITAVACAGIVVLSCLLLAIMAFIR